VPGRESVGPFSLNPARVAADFVLSCNDKACRLKVALPSVVKLLNMAVMKSSHLLVLAFSGLLALAACDSVDSDATYNDKMHDDMYKNGSLLSDKGGWSLFGSKDDSKKSQDNNGIGVNAFLWRASLDTISFMPIASADPFGGVILTDWYSASDTPNERTKLNIFVRDRELTANGVKVSVFRQTKTGNGWVDAPVAPATAVSIENAILTRARQLRMAQKQFN
jgi:hypothetical protein